MVHSHNALLRDGHVAGIHRNQTLKAASVKGKKNKIKNLLSTKKSQTLQKAIANNVII